MTESKNLHVRISHIALKDIKEKSKSCGISQSKLVRIAVQLTTKDDILQYLLDHIAKN